jgi:hypothetical protein
MMTDTLTGFTTEELDTLHKVLWGYLHEGVASAPTHTKTQELITKIERMRLVGKKVRFLHEGKELTGELRGYKDWEGILMADIASKGFIYRVGVKTELLGEV